MLTCATVTHMKLSSKKLAIRCFLIGMINAILNEETGEIMEYRHIMKNHKYRQLYKKSYIKELGVSPKEFQAKRKAPTPYIS